MEYRKEIVATPVLPLDYKKIEYPASLVPENDNASIEQAKAVSNAVQNDSNFTGSNAI